MFSLFGRSTKARPPGGKTARPRLESLESRWVPADVANLTVTYGMSKMITLSGDLTNTTTPAYQQIELTGKALGEAWTDAAGHFSCNLFASELGDVTATPAAGGGSQTITLTDVAPTLTLHVAEDGQGNVWRLSGTVTYDRANGLSVNFGGDPVSIQNQMTISSATDGSYSLTVTLNGMPSDNGSVWAQVVTPWGTYSAKAYATITQDSRAAAGGLLLCESDEYLP